jgi:hypothetical protein
MNFKKKCERPKIAAFVASELAEQSAKLSGDRPLFNLKTGKNK